MARRRFVLLDRDGTLIVEKHHLADPDAVELVAGAGEALRRLSRLDLGLVVVTNQSVVARGMLDLAGLAAVHERMAQQLRAADVQLDGIYFCPHHPDDGCACRKPRPGLALRAAAELGFEPSQCFVVGDQPTDIGLGQAVGATTVLVRTGYGEATAGGDGPRADHVVADLPAAAERIEALLRGEPQPG